MHGTAFFPQPLTSMSDLIRSLAAHDVRLSEAVSQVDEGRASRGPVMIEELENQRFQSDVDAAYQQRHILRSAERKPLQQRLKDVRDKKMSSQLSSASGGGKSSDAADSSERVDSAEGAIKSDELTSDQAEQRDLQYLLKQFKRPDNGLSESEKETLKEKYRNLARSSFGVADVVPTLSKDMARTFAAVKTVMGKFDPEKTGTQHEALKLFDQFEDSIGHAGLVADLNKVAALNAKERMPSVLGTRHVMNIWFAKNLLLIQSCYARATDLRGEFSGTCQIKEVASERETVRLLLKAPSMDDRSTSAFVDNLFNPASVDASQRAHACRAVRRCVGDLPITLWPIESLQQRQDFLIKLDEMAIGSDRQRSGIPSEKALIEIRQRARIERGRHFERNSG